MDHIMEQNWKTAAEIDETCPGMKEDEGNNEIMFQLATDED